MTVWKHSVSWSKFKLALECPLQLQNTIDKKPHGFGDGTYYTSLGKLVQFVFEQYFNQKVNLRPGGQEYGVIEKIFDRVIKVGYLDNLKVTYPHNKTEEDLIDAAKKHLENGFRVMKEMGLVKLAVRSEVKWNSVFRGFRMFGMVDFIRDGKSGMYIFDGKGHANKNADPRQVVYYALAIAASGHKIAGGGLIYWQHDYVPVDLRPEALKHFIDNEFAEARPWFEKLKNGTTEEFPARPEESVCKTCNWRNTCPFSKAKTPPMIEGLPQSVGFGELPARV